jgi:predicted TIM-barrel fold metal-dependent hydrolase
MARLYKFNISCLVQVLNFLIIPAWTQNVPPTQNVPQEIIINSGRPTFSSPYVSIPGKIALEEHIGVDLFSGVFTTPFVNFTNEVNFDTPPYLNDVVPRLKNIDERVQAMDAANISMSILLFGAPGIQGVFNTSFATYAATWVNDEVARVYKNGNYSGRFGFWCSNALQDPVNAAAELERCVKKLGGVGSFVGGYTNNGSANNVVYLDDPTMAPFLAKVQELNVPIYLHPRPPPPDQQRVYDGYNFLAGSPWGFSSETAAHVLRLMVAGIFDTYPNLTIILGHCGEGIPFFLPRIEHRMRHFSHYWPAKQSVRYYWEKNFYVTTSGVQDAGTLLDTVRACGEERVMFSVDYPFEDSVEIGGWFDRLELSGGTKKRIGYLNAKKLLRLGGGDD